VSNVAAVMKLKSTGWFVLLAAQAMLLSGCATSAVWRTGQFARYSEPADPSNLSLFYSSQNQDVLVEYSEAREDDDSIRRRAYWLHENAERLKERQKPRFVSLAQEQGLVSIPLVQSAAQPDSSLAEGLYAVVSTNGDAFALYTAGKKEGSYELPVYPDDSGRVKQVLLTPPAVVADATIVGGVIAYYCLPSAWSSFNGLTH